MAVQNYPLYPWKRAGDHNGPENTKVIAKSD